jgi:hypothetical protein
MTKLAAWPMKHRRRVIAAWIDHSPPRLAIDQPEQAPETAPAMEAL